MNLDILLRESATVADPSPRALQAARETLDAATHAAAERRVAIARRIRIRRHRRLGLAALVGAAAALAIVIAPTLGVGGTKPLATASAEEVLIRAGAAAGEQPDTPPGAPYWYSVVEYWAAATNEVTRRETWTGHTAPGVFIETGSVWNSEPVDTGEALFGPGITWDVLFALPTEPVALERDLRGKADSVHPEEVTDATMWHSATEMLMNSPASPALRKALWEVAAQIPGTTLGAAVTDSAGRPGIAVDRDGDRYIVDPDTGRLLEYLGYTTKAHVDLIWRGTYLEQGPTDTAPAS